MIFTYILVALIACYIILMIIVALYATPYNMWALEQAQALGRKPQELTMGPAFKYATMYYISPITGKKPPF